MVIINKHITTFILLFLLLSVGVSAKPSIYINPYAYQVPWLQQGTPPNAEQGDCMGASSVYAMELLRAKAEGIQPTYVDPPITRGVWVNDSGFTMRVDTKPAKSLSVNSIYQRMRTADPTLVDFVKLGNILKAGANYEEDYITPKNFLTNYYYPQSQSYINSNRVWAVNGFINATETTPDLTWERLKNEIYSNGVVIIEFRTYSTTVSSLAPGTVNFREPTGTSSTEHAMAAVGYNETTEVVYVLNSWGETMWNNPRPKIIGITKTYWQIGGLRIYVPRR